MDDRQRLEAIISVVCKYLPPDGIPINDAMSEIISLVDPLPPAQPAQEQWNAALDEAASRIGEIKGFGQATQDSFAVFIKGLKK